MKPLKRGRADLKENEELDDYIPSDSEDDYTEAEKKLLENTRKGVDSEDDDSEEEVYGVLSSGDDKDEEDNDMDSDIEGKVEDDLPNVRAWGKTKKTFYSTDYVDQDYGGFQGKDAEEADYEEQEARAIQERLAKQLDDGDFSLDTFMGEKSSVDDAGLDEQQHIKTDLTKMTKRQKLALFEKDSPEFSGLVEDFKVQMKVVQEKLEPMLAIIKEKKMPICPATSFIKTKYHLALNYCTNISFYLVLKARCRNVKTHPIIRRLVQYRQLMQQLAPLWTDIVEPQVDQLLEMQQNGQEIKLLQKNTRATERKLLNVLKSTSISEGEDDAMDESLKKKSTTKKMKVSSKTLADVGMDQSEEDAGGEIQQDQESGLDEEKGDEEAKRGITYQIAKNKGLTPHRKKEQRNPRVKNRNKYRKAQIQRRGQVRTVRKETERYGGEISGIKAGLRKGIKIKV